MKIYCLRDRLLDYLVQPFLAPGDNQVKASLSDLINSEQSVNAVTKAPHHFELWCLGEIHQDGTVEGQRSLICEASSLVRTGLREDPKPRAAISQGAAPQGEKQSRGPTASA